MYIKKKKKLSDEEVVRFKSSRKRKTPSKVQSSITTKKVTFI